MLKCFVVSIKVSTFASAKQNRYYNIITFMNFTLLITVLVTAITLVVAAYVMA